MCRNAQGVAIGLALALGCRAAPGATERGTAERFLDKLYVELSPAEALPVTSGAAEAAVREMVRLRAGAAPGEVRPRVTWERAGDPEGRGDATVLRYRLRIDAGGVPMRKEVALQLRRVGEAWTVAAFSERDLPPEAR